MNGFTVTWLAWIGVFVVVEIMALLDDTPGNTLSEHVWRWFSVKDRSSGWIARRAVLAFLMGWLTFHFLSGEQLFQ